MRCLITTILLFLITSGADAYACADGVGCAVIKETQDGFVALRSKPTASSRLLRRLCPYEIVIVSFDSRNPNPTWAYVVSVPSIDGGWEGWDNDKKVTTGYVFSKLISYANCPAELEQ